MELPEWEGYSFELARASGDAASRDLANAHMSLEEKSKAARLTLGQEPLGQESDQSHWVGQNIRAGAASHASPLREGARQEMASMDPCDLVRPPPELAVEEPRKWWNLIATAGLGGRATEEQRNKHFG